jgi:hypothetical protein
LISAAVNGLMWVIASAVIGALNILFADALGVALCSGIIYNGHSHVPPVTELFAARRRFPFDG